MLNETDYTKETLTKKQENQIDSLFAQYDNQNTPGCSVGVIRDGRFIYKKSFGIANLDYDIPITADSKFEIGSMTKQFTAACIALLAIEEKLNLDDDVRKYIPELPDYGKIITIRHLLHHTSGIRDYVQLFLYSDSINQFANHLNNDSLRIILKQKELNFTPGTKYLYSNSGYLLLAEIIKVISGISFAKFVADRIFKPLEMLNSFVNTNSKNIVKDVVISYERKEDEKFTSLSNTSNDIGAKGVVTTINDLLLWDQNFYNPKLGGVKLINMMLSKGVLENGNKIGYSLGLEVSTYNNLSIVSHGGGYQGFRSMLMRFPKQRISIIYMSNVVSDMFSLTNSVADIILASYLVNTNKLTKESNNETTAVDLSKLELDKFCGCFWCEEEKLHRKIYIKDGCLFYWRNEDSESQLVPVSSNELVMLNQNSQVRLNHEFNGNSKKISFYENNNHTLTLNSYKAIDFNMEYLSKYIGNYFCEELFGEYKIKIESEKLIFCVKDEIISNLNPIIPNTFKFENEYCFIMFIFNDKRKIIGFQMDSWRVKNLRFNKQ